MEQAEQNIQREFTLPENVHNKYILLSFIFITMSVGFLVIEFILGTAAFSFIAFVTRNMEVELSFFTRGPLISGIIFFVFTIFSNFAGFLLVFKIFKEKPDYIFTAVMALVVPCTALVTGIFIVLITNQ